MPLQLLRLLHQKYFSEPVTVVTQLKGDGSQRIIFRVTGSAHTSIGIHGGNRAENVAFVEFTRTFRSHGLPVPEIYCTDLEHDVYLEEDLGDATLFDWMSERKKRDSFSDEVISMYEEVLRSLPRFQIEAAKDIDYSLCYQYAEFAHASMLFDLHYFRDRFLANVDIKSIDHDSLEHDFTLLIEFLLAAQGEYFLYRDFQSRNIMIKNGEPYFIDYQSGRKGALPYDVASLLNDARAEIPFEVRIHLIDVYLDAAQAYDEIHRDEFMKYYDGFALIRILQALGAFGNLGIVRGKKFFLESIPYGMKNLELFLTHETTPIALPTLREILHRLSEDPSLRTITPESMHP